MGVNLSIKNAPEDVVQRLKERAARNHRSLNGELLSILEQATLGHPKLTVDEAIEKIRSLRLPKGGPAAVDLIRADRDSR